MKYSFLKSKIDNIQSDYKNLLNALLPKLQDNFSLEILDEICLFWKKNRSVVELYLQEDLYQCDAYIFTASSCINLESKEHYPFLLFGTHHAFDDPLPKYAELYNKMPNAAQAVFVQQQIFRAIENNIALLSLDEEILVFPIRQNYTEQEESQLVEFVERLFLNLFPNFNSLDEYYEKCSSIADIIQHGIPNLSKAVMFSEGENPVDPIEERFERAIDKMPALPITIKTDAQKFFYIVYGYLFQAIDILVSCDKYHCVPYVNYSVACHYISLIATSCPDETFGREMCFKMHISFATFCLCDEAKLSRAGLVTFLICRNALNFSDYVFSLLGHQGIKSDNYLTQSTQGVIISALSELYSLIEEKA